MPQKSIFDLFGKKSPARMVTVKKSKLSNFQINGQSFGLSGLMEMFSDKMKSDSDMTEMKEKIVDCIKNFHLESYAYKLLVCYL